jgi:hypothetical protein
MRQRACKRLCLLRVVPSIFLGGALSAVLVAAKEGREDEAVYEDLST